MTTLLKPGTARWVRHIPLILALLIPTALLAQGSPIAGLPSWFAGPTGAPKAGAIVTICNYPSVNIPCTNYASVYRDILLSVPINQTITPIVTDGLGNVPTVYIAPGTYAATVSGAGITTPQGPYVFNISCVVGSSCVSTNTANTWTALQTFNAGLTSSGPNTLGGGGSFAGTYTGTPTMSGLWTFNAGLATTTLSASGQITSTVASGTAPFVIASTTVVPNLNAQLHGGLTAPASAILGLTDSQAPTNKTFDISANTLKNSSNTAGHVPRNNGAQYVDGQLGAADLSDGVTGTGAVVRGTTPTIATPVINGASTGTGIQGSDSKLMTAGTISGTSASLCTDANGGATTSGCPSGLYNGTLPNGTYYVTSDFSTSSTSLVNIPGLSWTMPANAATVSGFSCRLIYTQNTAGAANSFGIQDVTVAPTNIAAKAEEFINQVTGVTDNTMPTLTSTTATAIGGTFTPGTIGVFLSANIDGLIEQPSNASSSAINIMAETGNASDALIIKRGSFCRVF